MPELDDQQLLREFAETNSETAFATLVARHVNLVYSTALRFSGNPHRAEEISQAVFIILARKAKSLGGKTVLSGWLYQTARLTAANVVKGEVRRQRREQEAYMQSTLNEPDAAWEQIAPLLDDAMGQLGEADRIAVVLRYFENKTAREVAAALRLTEAAAHKRVNRALDKLRTFFSKRGVTLAAAAIAGAVSANSVHAAPVGLAKTISTVALAKGAAVSVSTLTLVKGALTLMAWTKAKTAIVVGAGMLLAAGTATVTIKEIQKPRTYPWQVHPGNITLDQVNQPPQVRILPSKFHISDWATLYGKMIGTGVRAQNVVASAYGHVTSARVVFSADLPTNRFDYIACLPDGLEANAAALQQEVKRKFGVVGRVEKRSTDAWLLKVKNPNLPGLKRSDMAPGNALRTVAGGFHGWHEGMSNLAYVLEDKSNLPIIDATGIWGRFDFDLNCTEADLETRNWDKVNRALDRLGLELVSTNLPLDILVVEKAE